MTFEREQEQMIADIESGVAVTRTTTGRDHLDQRVMKVCRSSGRIFQCLLWRNRLVFQWEILKLRI